MLTINNVHQQFASFFKSEKLQPYAYLVSKKISEGHICVALPDIDEEVDIPAFYGKVDVRNYRSILKDEPLVAIGEGSRQPFVLLNDKLYMQRYFYYETVILNRIQQLIFTEKELQEQRRRVLQQHTSLLQELFPAIKESGNNEKTDWQMAAAIVAVLNNFTIITGGPGTGKTTTVAKILALLFTINPTIKVALAAPTGKAAARMAESLKAASFIDPGLQAYFQKLIPSTLHRLLKLSPGSTKVKYDQTNPLDYDLIVVDESSMIDVALFSKLLLAVGNHTRLIMLGDKDQLASVEAGSLFGDLCTALPQLNIFSKGNAGYINSFLKGENGKIANRFMDDTTNHLLFQHIIELKHSHRFSDNEGIGRFSKAVIGNQQDVIKQFLKPGFDQQVTIDINYKEDLFAAFVLGYNAYIAERDITTALQKFNNLRVLCAVRQGEHGLYTTNKKIEFLLQQKGAITGMGEFYENRPVMVTKNYYDLKLFNGDIGIVRADENGILKVWFLNSEQQLQSILPGFLGESETVFAMTIHKSQGSEFDNVLVLLPDADNIELLTRELLYTAVTRARKKVLLQGTEENILQTAHRSVKRISGIAERFAETDNNG